LWQGTPDLQLQGMRQVTAKDTALRKSRNLHLATGMNGISANTKDASTAATLQHHLPQQLSCLVLQRVRLCKSHCCPGLYMTVLITRLPTACLLQLAALATHMISCITSRQGQAMTGCTNTGRKITR
jgi:hypothetical protein